jgi:hypothetical protein
MTEPNPDDALMADIATQFKTDRWWTTFRFPCFACFTRLFPSADDDVFVDSPLSKFWPTDRVTYFVAEKTPCQVRDSTQLQRSGPQSTLGRGQCRRYVGFISHQCSHFTPTRRSENSRPQRDSSYDRLTIVPVLAERIYVSFVCSTLPLALLPQINSLLGVN